MTDEEREWHRSVLDACLEDDPPRDQPSGPNDCSCQAIEAGPSAPGISQEIGRGGNTNAVIFRELHYLQQQETEDGRLCQQQMSLNGGTDGMQTSLETGARIEGRRELVRGCSKGRESIRTSLHYFSREILAGKAIESPGTVTYSWMNPHSRRKN